MYGRHGVVPCIVDQNGRAVGDGNNQKNILFIGDLRIVAVPAPRLFHDQYFIAVNLVADGQLIQANAQASEKQFPVLKYIFFLVLNRKAQVQRIKRLSTHTAQAGTLSSNDGRSEDLWL